ncbi:transposable element Tc1 transposase [Trichonephila clavipes]|nr:transposable element Tc1 transposase [Trichonephila clavipes]
MLTKNVFKNTKKPLSTVHRCCVIRLREGGFFSCAIAERLGRVVSTVHACWEYCLKETGFQVGMWHYCERKPSYSAFGCKASYSVCCNIIRDENKFCLQASDGHVLVRKSPGEPLQPNGLRPRQTGPTPGAMVWGADFSGSRIPLVVIPNTLTANLDVRMVI